jgi:hypothetical protein
VFAFGIRLAVANSGTQITSQQVEDFKLKRAQKVSRGTTDKDLAVLKALFNCLTALGRRAARPSVAEDDDALCAPVAGVPLSRSQPARSASANASTEPREGQEKQKGKKRAKRSRRQCC